MTTLRHLQKLWNSKTYSRIARELLFGRPENSLPLQIELANTPAAAALILIRLDELNQNHSSLAAQMLRVILLSQELDGGWRDPLVSAICLRALMTGRGAGISIERGLAYLANLQKTEGIWPKVGLRRLPADRFVSAFILFQLGTDERFRQTIRFFDLVEWLESHESELDPEARRLWDHARLRCTLSRPRQSPTLWS